MSPLHSPSTQKGFSSLSIVMCVVILMSAWNSETKAQARIISALIKPDTSETHRITGDTIRFRTDGIPLTPTSKPAKSGSLAMLLSAILPGAGQVYAHRYYTIPIILGFSGYYISEWIKANDTYITYRDQFAATVLADTSLHEGDKRIKVARDNWHNYRDGFVVYFAIVYFLNIIDAYVGATLYNFDVSDDLGTTTATIRFRIPFH
jgi:hypothetical protein